MNKKMTHEEKEILIDIYGDLAGEHKWPWDSKSPQIFKESEALPYYIPESVVSFGEDHPKFPLISKLFCEQSAEPEPVDCHNRRDWWTALVHMLDDTKQFLSKSDRKELYQDLKCLIEHRLSREEY